MLFFSLLLLYNQKKERKEISSHESSQEIFFFQCCFFCIISFVDNQKIFIRCDIQLFFVVICCCVQLYKTSFLLRLKAVHVFNFDIFFFFVYPTERQKEVRLFLIDVHISSLQYFISLYSWRIEFLSR